MMRAHEEGMHDATVVHPRRRATDSSVHQKRLAKLISILMQAALWSYYLGYRRLLDGEVFAAALSTRAPQDAGMAVLCVSSLRSRPVRPALRRTAQSRNPTPQAACGQFDQPATASVACFPDLAVISHAAQE
jgi:hypothetical protein